MAERRESVRLELHDAGFSSGMVKNAASVALVERALKSLDGTNVVVHERISQSVTRVDALSKSSRDADGSINQLTGRLRVLGEVAAIFAPTVGPIGGVAVAGMAGLASQMGFAAVAGGVLIGALQGVGDALGAMNKAQLEPTDANLDKARKALERLSPAARDFAKEAFALKPALTALRDLGAEAVMPGLTESLDSIERLGPRVAGIMEAVGGALGDIASDSAASLASERWQGFFEFIRVEAPDALRELASTVGSLTHGMAELWQAFTPLNDDFSSWLMDIADGFDDWATGLSATEGFAEFIDYIRTTGPQVAETFGAIFNAVVQLVQASAPLGGPVLAGIEAVANAIGAIADSDLGTPIMAGVTALALLNRTLAVTASLSKVSLSSGLFAGLGTASKGIKGQAGSIRSDIAAMSDTMVAFGANTEKAGQAADRMKGRLAAGAGLAGFAVAATGAADAIGLTNTMSLALMGSLAGPPGAAIGAAAGALLDMKSAGDGATEAIRGLDAAVQSGNIGALKDQLAAAKAELADINDLDFGGDIFDRIGFQIADTFGGPSADDAAAKIKAAEKAVEDLAKAEKMAEVQSKASAIAMLSATGANIDLAKWSRRSKEDIEAQAKALNLAREAARETAGSFVNLGDGLNDSKVSLSEWIKQMADSARNLEQFTANSQKAARRGLDEGLIASLRETGEEGALRMRQLANGTRSAIDDANASFRRGERAMQSYVDFVIPPKKVGVDINPAMTNIKALEARLRAIRDEDVFINVRQIGSTTLGPRNESADGGSVPKTGLPYADRHLYLLADGEEVISNRHGQADRHRSLLKDINANRLAEGGTAGKGARALRRTPEERLALLEAIKAVRDLQRELAKDGKDRLKGIERQIAVNQLRTAKAELGALKASGGPVVDNTDALEEAIRRLTRTAEIQTEALDNATAQTEKWASKMDEVAQATVSGFNTGLFERDSNPWAAGASGGPLANLTRDIAGLQQRGALQDQLAGLGISGEALAAMLSQGSNADLSALIASGQATAVAAAFNQRAALQGSVGAAGGQAAFGAEFAAASAEQRVLAAAAQQTNVLLVGANSRLERLETAINASADRFGDRVNGTATSAAQGRPNKPRKPR